MLVKCHIVCYYVNIIIMTIDLLDEQLFNLLMEDARKSSDVLAKQLNVSSSTIRRRMKRLVEQEIIHIIALPDPSKIGLSLEAVVALDIVQENVNAVIEVLRKHPKVRWVSATSGRFDVMAYVWFASTDELYDFMGSEIGSLEGLKNSETFICLHVAKHP